MTAIAATAAPKMGARLGLAGTAATELAKGELKEIERSFPLNGREASCYHGFIMPTTSKTNETGALDRMLDPLSDVLTPALARRLVRFRADAATQARVQELADKCNEGELTPAERREYAAYVRAIHVISVLQSKARIALAKRRKPK